MCLGLALLMSSFPESSIVDITAVAAYQADGIWASSISNSVRINPSLNRGVSSARWYF